MMKFASSSEAFRIARERVSVAATIEHDALHMAIYDAREAGLSVRATADALRVPKSTVARHWREGHRCADVVPVWGSAEAWREANRVVWAHDPDAGQVNWVPYNWYDEPDGSRNVVLRARGVVWP